MGDLKKIVNELLYPQVLVILIPHILLGFFASKSLNFFLFVLACIIIMLIDFATNVLNNFLDWEIDEINKKRVYLHQNVKKKRLFYIFILLSLPLLLTFLLNIYIILLTIMGYLIGINYNTFLKLKDKIFLSNLAIGFTYGLITYCMGYFIASTDIGRFLQLLWIPIYCMLVIIILSIVKDYEDEMGDREHNKKTFVTLLGRKRTIYLQFFSVTVLIIFALTLNILYNRLLILIVIIPYLLVISIVIRLFKANSVEEFKVIHKHTRLINILFILILFPYILI